MSTCRGCGRAIEWVCMKSGKMMPIDPDPHFVEEIGSDTFITEEGDTIVGRVAWPTAQEEKDRMAVAFVPHWATCPRAREFRRERR